MTIDPKLEERLRRRAEAASLTIEAYIERLLAAEDELDSLAVEALNSGDPIQLGPGYWEEKHRRLDERLKNTSAP